MNSIQPSRSADQIRNFFQRVFNHSQFEEVNGFAVDKLVKEVTGHQDYRRRNGFVSGRMIKNFEVAQLENAIVAIEQNGGEIITTIIELPNIGKMVYFRDPCENTYGIIQKYQ